MKHLLRNGKPTVWRHRDLRIVGPGRAVSVLGDEIALVALLLHLHDVGAGSPGVMALLMAAAVPTIALAPWAGRIADRQDSRTLVVGAALLQGLVCVALALAGPLWQVLVLVLVLQSASTVANPTWQALVPRVVGESEAARAVAALQSLTTLAGLAGPALGGLLFGLGGVRVALLADAVSFGLLAVAGLAVRTRRGGARDLLHAAADAVPPRALDGVRLLRADLLLWPMMLALMVYVLVGEAVNVAEVFLVRDHLHGTSVEYGLVGLSAGAGIVVGSVLAGRLSSTASRTLGVVVAAAVQAAAVLAGGLVPDVVRLLAVFAVLGAANGVLNAAIMGLFVTRSPERSRGQVLAAVGGMSRGTSVLALLLGGWAATTLGPAPTFVWSGVASLLVAGALAVRVVPLRAVPLRAAPEAVPDVVQAHALP
jgi:MFS family permease